MSKFVNKNDHSGRWTQVLQYGAFALILFGAKLYLIHNYANATPFWDQWDAEAAYLYQPYLSATLKWSDLFAPHLEHRIFVARLITLSLLIMNGIWNPLLQMVVNAVLHISVIGLCVFLLAKVLGRKYLPMLLSFSLCLFAVPYAWENTLAGFQSMFYTVLLFSMTCLWFTVTKKPLSRSWWLGILSAILAFLSLASGVFALAAAIGVSVTIYALGLCRTHRQLWAVVILTLLFVMGVVLTPVAPGHAVLKASSVAQFSEALSAILAWPIAMTPTLLFALLKNLPALVFALLLLWKRPPASDKRWFLLALVIWTLAQAVSIAYGRVSGRLASRYLDLFAIGILVNFACLISVCQNYGSSIFKWSAASIGIWAIAVFLALGFYAQAHVPAELAAKREAGIAQELNTKNFVKTGDINHLKNKPFMHIPYPNAERLASILASQKIQSILPANIQKLSDRDATAINGRMGVLTLRILNNYVSFILLGLGIVVLLLLGAMVTKQSRKQA
jgi:hypothetical protein